MDLQLSNIRNDNRLVEVKAFLPTTILGALATQGNHLANIATIFYVFDEDSLYFKSRTTSTHSLNVGKNSNVSFCVYHRDSDYKTKYGVQIIGICERVKELDKMQKVVDLYSDRFVGSGAKLPSIAELCADDISSTFYSIKIGRFKIIDEGDDINRTMLEYSDFG